jgi:hypothetical protein
VAVRSKRSPYSVDHLLGAEGKNNNNNNNNFNGNSGRIPVARSLNSSFVSDTGHKLFELHIDPINIKRTSSHADLDSEDENII